VFANKCERVFLDFVLWGAENGDGAVEGEVGVKEGEQTIGVAATRAGGAKEGSGDLDPSPGAGDGRDLGVAQECERVLVAVLVGEVGAGKDGGIEVDDQGRSRSCASSRSSWRPRPRVESTIRCRRLALTRRAWPLRSVPAAAAAARSRVRRSPRSASAAVFRISVARALRLRPSRAARATSRR
jgi:hypothetical protein